MNKCFAAQQQVLASASLRRLLVPRANGTRSRFDEVAELNREKPEMPL